jgi:predicted dienelactone hydrolase
VDKDGPLATYPLAAGFGLTAMVAVEGAPFSEVGKRKLIVFSHGSEGVSTQSTPLMETLASYGYVVVAPEHIGNSQGSPGDPFEVAARNRFNDVSFIIDTVFAWGRDESNDLFGAFDESGVGVTGHSFGGWTSIASATGWDGAKGDERVAAIAPISGVIEDRFPADVLAALSLPVLLLGGTKDTEVPISNNEYAYANLSSPAYQVDIKEATHTHFANVCAIGDKLIELGIGMDKWSGLGAEALLAPYEDTCSEGVFPLEKAVRLQNLYLVAFFNHHLQKVPDNSGVLTRQYALDNEPDVVFSGK